jgi:phosphoribosylaminoimidazole (AIR) synthetase
MKRVFNLGIGFCIVVPPDIELEDGYEIGTVQ